MMNIRSIIAKTIKYEMPMKLHLLKLKERSIILKYIHMYKYMDI